MIEDFIRIIHFYWTVYDADVLNVVSPACAHVVLCSGTSEVLMVSVIPVVACCPHTTSLYGTGGLRGALFCSVGH